MRTSRNCPRAPWSILLWTATSFFRAKSTVFSRSDKKTEYLLRRISLLSCSTRARSVLVVPQLTVDEALLKLAGFLKAVFAAWFRIALRISGTVPLPMSTAITDWSSLFSTRTPGKEVTPRLARAACSIQLINFSPKLLEKSPSD